MFLDNLVFESVFISILILKEAVVELQKDFDLLLSLIVATTYSRREFFMRLL